MGEEKNCIIVSKCEILLLSIMRENVDGEFIAFDDEEDDKTFFVLLFLCKLRN